MTSTPDRSPRKGIRPEQLAKELEAVQARTLELRGDLQALLDEYVLPATTLPNVVQTGRTLKTAAEHLAAALLVLDRMGR